VGEGRQEMWEAEASTGDKAGNEAKDRESRDCSVYFRLRGITNGGVFAPGHEHECVIERADCDAYISHPSQCQGSLQEIQDVSVNDKRQEDVRSFPIQ